MSEVLLKEARDLIKAERYEEARAILQTLGDPEARAMLTELDARREEGSTRFTASESETRRKQRGSRESDPEST
jgi:hypothetical protein